MSDEAGNRKENPGKANTFLNIFKRDCHCVIPSPSLNQLQEEEENARTTQSGSCHIQYACKITKLILIVFF